MSGAIKFACPSCDRVCKVPAELAGRQARCPGCRKGLEVPMTSATHLDSGRAARMTASDLAGPVAGARRSSEQARRSGAGKVRSGSASKRVPDFANAPPADLPDDSEPAIDEPESETQALVCRGCQLEVQAGAFVCPYCNLQLRKEVTGGLHWAIPLAYVLLIPLPLFGLFFARIGLKAARERQNHEGAAWGAVWANGINSLIGLLWMINRLNR